MNTDLRDGLNFLLSGKPIAILGRNSSQSIPNNAGTSVGWDLETVDRDGGHSTSTNNSRYTAQTAGWYRVQGSVQWASNATGIRDCGFLVNNAIQSQSFTGVGSSVANHGIQNDGLILLSVNDYVEFSVYQNSGAALNVSPTSPDQRNRFILEWVSS
ncbi:hypothetical protein [Streptomyces albidoflavus]|uniref:hypothetical protein n=1 Tax=Streptomyces albidoflavus TaxID=1886 RepID=UPI0033238514